jgi:uncharacterized protein YqjF (DUF2071 family)
LPYYNADIDLKQEGQTIDYRLRRSDRPAAEFHGRWTVGEPLPVTQPGSLEFFLTERYCLYSEHGERLCRARIHHRPWPLRTAKVSSFFSTMIEAQGLKAPEGDPLLHYAEEISVDIWALKKIETS